VKKRRSAKRRRPRPAGPSIAPRFGPRWLRLPLVIAAITYLSMTFLDGSRTGIPERVLPPTLRYFVQTSCLFPNAAEKAIDYRLEGWSCAESKFVEIDTRHDFPVDGDNKESRFQRAAQFYRQNREVMHALESYILERHNGHDETPRYGGIRITSLRIPLPHVGGTLPRWNPRPLDEYPLDQQRHWYWTPWSTRTTRCGSDVAPSDEPLPAENEEP
jgi:hypothetical protein